MRWRQVYREVCVFAAMLCAAPPAIALDLPLPEAAILAAEDRAPSDSVTFPTSPWSDSGPATRTAEGQITRQAWSIRNSLKTTLQLLEPLRESLLAMGYEVHFECQETACGGFDFRYGLNLLPEPDMHVDLGDYRYLLASRPDGEGSVSLVVSRSANTGYIHVTFVGPPAAVDPASEPQLDQIAAPLSDPGEAQTPIATLADALEQTGRAVLDDLRFATGSAELEAVPFASLEALALWLRDKPDVGVTLVGHSDAVGPLAQNIELSRRRAASVAARLVEAHGVPARQVSAEGVGYLVPRALNTTAEGRALNRRVEVVRTTP